MSLLLKILGGSSGGYIVVAILVTFGGLGATIWVQGATIAEYKAKLSTSAADLKATIAANAMDQGVISSLQKALDTWKDSATKAAHDQADMVKTLQAVGDKLAVANLKLADREKADNVLPDCRKIESTDIAAVCPGHAAAERLHSADSLQGPHRQGSGPDIHPH